MLLIYLPHDMLIAKTMRQMLKSILFARKERIR